MTATPDEVAVLVKRFRYIANKLQPHPDGFAYHEAAYNLRKAADALESLSPPAGMVMVPEEPTDAMRVAGIMANGEHDEKYPVDHLYRTVRIYRAMLSASEKK